MRQLGPPGAGLVMGTDPGWATIIWLKRLTPPVKPAVGLWHNVHARLLFTDRLRSLSPSLPRSSSWPAKSCGGAERTWASAAAKAAWVSAPVAATSGSTLAPPGRVDAISTEDEQRSRPFRAEAA